jgi:lipopolysaccharide/colanic/teichoic acid biosynthesis glycosyltransferase
MNQQSRGWYARWGKPCCDRAVGCVVLVLSLPVQVTVALVVLISLGRPVLLRQTRVGRDGVPFRLLKFRTMRPDRRAASQQPSAPDRRSGVPSPDDPRHTRVGLWLRRWSLDELPQLFNVVRGDMSLVGPRPDLVEMLPLYQPWQLERHGVRPGLTGSWQVTHRSSGSDLRDHVQTDIAYVHAVSMRTDLRILLATPRAVLRETPPAPSRSSPS